LEDALTKVMKLIANLSTEEKTATRDLQSVRDQALLADFFKSMMQAVASRQVETSEEFILNSISCTTNILFYDTIQKQILTDDVRSQIFQAF
jgi:hypothetical protein